MAALSSASSRDALVEECAAALVQAFADYNAEFRAITRRAPLRFEARDWRMSQRDAVERIELYDKCVNRAVAHMRERLGEDATERALWSSIKRRFTELIDELPDLEFDKTFFNSVTRRTFGTIGTDAAVEFVALDLDPIGSITSQIETHVYSNRGSLELLFEEVLADFRFRTPYLDFDRSVRIITNEVRAQLEADSDAARPPLPLQLPQRHGRASASRTGRRCRSSRSSSCARRSSRSRALTWSGACQVRAGRCRWCWR